MIPNNELPCLYHLVQQRDESGKPLRKLGLDNPISPTPEISEAVPLGHTQVARVSQTQSRASESVDTHDDAEISTLGDDSINHNNLIQPTHLSSSFHPPLPGSSSYPLYFPPPFTDFNPALNELEVEIGSGKGSFLVNYALKHPELFLCGLEQVPSIAQYAAQRLAKREGINKAFLIQGEAHLFLREFLPPKCVKAFHMYFPDPWPKKRHAKRRTLNSAFLETLIHSAKPGALFYWGTDFHPYHLEALECFEKMNFPCLIKDAEPTEGIQTNFEKKYRLEGRPIYRSVFQIPS